MSIYKGGYILADISDTALSADTTLDILSQDLKDYLRRYIKNGMFSKEILLKPIKLLCNFMSYNALMEFKFLSDDYTEIYALITFESVNYKITINAGLRLTFTYTTLEIH